MDTTKLKNNKYKVGNFKKQNEYRGWFVGAFLKDEDPCNSDKIEILYKEHSAGDNAEAHYHKEKIELLLFLKGKAKYKINGKEVILTEGSYLFVDVNNIIEGDFLKDSAIFAIHSPSIPTDKVTI